MVHLFDIVPLRYDTIAENSGIFFWSGPETDFITSIFLILVQTRWWSFSKIDLAWNNSDCDVRQPRLKNSHSIFSARFVIIILPF